MPAVWTDSNDNVVRVVYDETDVDTSGAFIVDSVPEPSQTEPWMSVQLKYTDADGFTTSETDPFSGLNMSNSDKNELYAAVKANDLVKARNIIESYL